MSGGWTEPPHVLRAVEESTEPSPLTSGFGAEAFGGIVHGVPQVDYGCFLETWIPRPRRCDAVNWTTRCGWASRWQVVWAALVGTGNFLQHGGGNTVL